MSLVTRCTACGTLFKVVADQLKISQGWVRCGQCAHVFDAQANLVADGSTSAFATHSAAQISTESSLESITPTPATSEANNAIHLPADDENSISADELQAFKNKTSASLPAYLAKLESDKQKEQSDAAQADARMFQPGVLRDESELDSEAGPSTTSWASSEYASQHAGVMGIPQGQSVSRSFEPTSLIPSGASTPPSSLSSELASDKLSSSFNAEPSTPPVPTPSFVKQAQRAARWRSPWVRAGLLLVALLLMGALALQMVLQDKDYLAASYPQAKPWLVQLCQQTGCRVEALRRIESMVVDSSSFNRINKNNQQPEASLQSYKLAITLKNAGTVPVAPPHVELSLQDAQDQPIVRRVLSPADLGSTLDRLMPAQELAGSVTLQIPTAQLAGSRINGYRVLAFYP